MPSWIFSSSDLPEGRLSCSIRARFSASAAAARRTYSSAFSDFPERGLLLDLIGVGNQVIDVRCHG